MVVFKMITKLSDVRFQGQPNSNPNTQKPLIHFPKPNQLLRQPAQDEVKFTGAVLNAQKLGKVVKKLGLELIDDGGRHGKKIIGYSEKLGSQVRIPVPMHGGRDIATGTANSIAKELGYKNVRSLLEKL
jgi:predicted RNA binding protein YcfA (HicA-like mRNA interferase family)